MYSINSKRNHIRQAKHDDLGRIAEIEIFNYRLNFYPIFLDDQFYFNDLQVNHYINQYCDQLSQYYVYDDGVIKGFIRIQGNEVKKLFVEPVLQNQNIGSQLLDYAITYHDVSCLWALEKNKKAISFYEKHGFCKTDIRKLEDDTNEYLVYLKR